MLAYYVGTNCPVLITYRNTPGMPGYVDDEMQMNKQYIALGHNALPYMVSVIFYLKQYFRGFPINDHCDTFKKSSQSHRHENTSFNLIYFLWIVCPYLNDF